MLGWMWTAKKNPFHALKTKIPAMNTFVVAFVAGNLIALYRAYSTIRVSRIIVSFMRPG